jgi:signal transduction histidine kinase
MILVVDDRPENLFALKSILERNDFVVETAGSGEEALKKVLQKNYSLIILDVQMPDMDGFEVAEMILGNRKSMDTPIIFLSAISKEKKFIMKGYKSGGMDYITKPVDPDILLLKVKSMYLLSEQKTELKRIQQTLMNEIVTRRQAEKELAIRIDQLRSIMETLPQITFTIARDGAVEYVNSAWFDYSPQVDTFPGTHPDDQRIWREWDDYFASGREFVREVRLQRLDDGSYRHYQLRILPVRRDNEIYNWVGAFNDIHEQKLANEVLEQHVAERTVELVKKNHELELSNNELQQFAWVISHDLKEPIRKIMTFTDMIAEKYFSQDEAAKKDFQRIIKSSERMSTLINDLLDFSRISIPARFEKVSLDTLFEEVLGDFEYRIQQTGATITKMELPEIEAVPSQMRQVFQNLLSNSLKFIRPGVPPVIRVRCEIFELPGEREGMNECCRIEFTDNGIGFDEQYLDKIFMVFQRLNNGSSYEGTGIGLAIAKKSIEKHHGTIMASSELDKGTTFTMTLPLKQEATKQELV